MYYYMINADKETISFVGLEFKQNNDVISIDKIKALKVQHNAVIKKLKQKRTTDVFVNLELKNDKLTSKTGNFEKFIKTETKPATVLTEIKDTKDVTLGYRVINANGNLKALKKEDLIAYAVKENKKGNTAFSNLILVQDKDKETFMRNYKGCAIPCEVIKREYKNSQVAKIDTKENNFALEKLHSTFTPEQIKELKLGKKHEVNYKIYANPKFSTEQMKILRETLELKLNAKLFADPEYDIQVMQFLKADLKNKMDIKYYLNPKYNLKQVAQLSLGYLHGIDVSKYSSPALSASEMETKRIALEQKLWNEKNIKISKNIEKI